MDSENKARLRCNFKNLVDNISVDEICNDLVSEEIIDDEEFEKICNPHFPLTRKQRVRTLVFILKTKPEPNVMPAFCRVLRTCEANYGYLAEALENCDISLAPDEVDGLTDEEKGAELQKTINEQSMMLLKVLKAQEEQQEIIKELSEKNRILAERDVQLTALKSRGFTESNLKEFADLFVITKSASESGNVPRRAFPVRQNNATGVAKYLRMFGIGSANSLPEECLIACRLSIDLVHYVVDRENGKQPREPFSDHAMVMRNRVEEGFFMKYVDVVKNLQMLDISEINGYRTFETVAEEMFVDGKCNEGRILVWFAFCAYLAPELKCSDDALDLYGTYVWYLLDRHLASNPSLMEQVGGWQGFLEFLVRPGLLTQSVRYIPRLLYTLFLYFPDRL